MSCNNLTCCVLLILFVSKCLTQESREPFLDVNVKEHEKMNTSINLQNCTMNHPLKERYTFEPYTIVNVSMENIPPGTAFMIFQMHTYEYNVTLSYDEMIDQSSNRSLFGSNIGLYIDTTANDTTQMFLRNDNVHKVQALFVIVPYDNQAPIPGGCNMEFNVEIAPYQKLYLSTGTVTEDFQPSSMPLTSINESFCEHNPVQHDVYRLYLSEQDLSVESYFEGISNMLSVQDIIRYGEKIPQPTSFSPMRRIYSAYPGTGSIYAVVTSYNNQTAAYVPTFTYACSPLVNPDSCRYLIGALPQTVCALNLIIGLLCIYVGHRCFRIELCFDLYLTGTFIGYVCSVAAADYGTSTNIGIGMATGIMMVVTILIIYCLFAKKSYRVLVATVSLGPFMACILYCIFADVPGTLEKDWLFGLFIVAVILIVFFIAKICPTVVSTLTCGILSAYAVIFSIDYYAGSSLKYIIINMIRRLSVSGFKVAHISPPFQAKDVCLVIFWCCLTVIRVGRYYLRKNKIDCSHENERMSLL